MAKRAHLGTFKAPADYAAWPPQRKREFAKRIADQMRQRAGQPPTDEKGRPPPHGR